MKKLLMSIASIGIAFALLGTGTFAFFSDPEIASGNTFTAGTLDLRVSDHDGGYTDDPISAVISMTNMAPCQETDLMCIYFKNVGTIDGYVTVDISYVENDDPEDNLGNFEYAMGHSSGHGAEVTAKNFARHLWVTEAYVDGGTTNVAPYWAQQIGDPTYSPYADTAAALADVAIVDIGSGNYLPTVYGLTKITLHFWTPGYGDTDIIFQQGDVHYECLKVKMDPAVGNEYQFDGIDVTITATLQQDCSTV